MSGRGRESAFRLGHEEMERTLQDAQGQPDLVERQRAQAHHTTAVAGRRPKSRNRDHVMTGSAAQREHRHIPQPKKFCCFTRVFKSLEIEIQ